MLCSYAVSGKMVHFMHLIYNLDFVTVSTIVLTQQGLLGEEEKTVKVKALENDNLFLQIK